MTDPTTPTPAAAEPAAFERLPDLASARLGGVVLVANDDFFAPKENLLREAPPVWDAHRYTDRGKWMDGWETRRRRKPGHDWCLIRLGLAGIPRGVVVDTAHFRGNFPERCSLEGCDAPVGATAEELLAVGTEWIDILPPSPLRGDAANRFALETAYRFTHLRLSIHPDGGVARLRVHGEVAPGVETLIAHGDGDGTLDLVSLTLGARAVAVSDGFFGGPDKLLLPDAPRGMFDGWETRRRRGPGNDWAVIRLAAPGVPERIEVDTSFFKGNAPGRFSLDGLAADRGEEPTFEPDGEPVAPSPAGETASGWLPLLLETDLEPDRRHVFDLPGPPPEPVTHVRFSIYPDGGVARLRLPGRLTPEAREALALAELNAVPPAAAARRLLDCCGSSRWAVAMAARRPFAERAALLAAAGEEADRLGREDWLEAFAAHPPIGGGAPGGDHPRAERPRGERAAGWSAAEQSGVGEDPDLAARLADANRRYRERFGHLFIVCASGKSGDEMLARLEKRLQNDLDTELAVAAGEERKIVRLRLEKLLGGENR